VAEQSIFQTQVFSTRATKSLQFSQAQQAFLTPQNLRHKSSLRNLNVLVVGCLEVTMRHLLLLPLDRATSTRRPLEASLAVREVRFFKAGSHYSKVKLKVLSSEVEIRVLFSEAEIKRSPLWLPTRKRRAGRVTTRRMMVRSKPRTISTRPNRQGTTATSNQRYCSRSRQLNSDRVANRRWRT
jgi:hypothetical protein